MKTTVLLFGHYREIAGGEPIELEVPEGETVRSLANRLSEAYPKLSGIETYCRFALNEEYATLDAILTEGDTVAVLPPMSGG